MGTTGVRAPEERGEALFICAMYRVSWSCSVLFLCCICSRLLSIVCISMLSDLSSYYFVVRHRLAISIISPSFLFFFSFLFSFLLQIASLLSSSSLIASSLVASSPQQVDTSITESTPLREAVLRGELAKETRDERRAETDEDNRRLRDSACRVVPSIHPSICIHLHIHLIFFHIESD